MLIRLDQGGSAVKDRAVGDRAQRPMALQRPAEAGAGLGSRRPRLDVVVPVLNEQAGVAEFHASLAGVLHQLPWDCRVIYVDDGSSDRTSAVIGDLPTGEVAVECIRLSRNFGHQAAITAGLDRADGEAVITMDGDGEHPPELIPDMVSLFESGIDVVLGVRRSEGKASGFKRVTRGTFYRLLAALSETEVIPGAADFRLLSHRAVQALRSMPEYHRYLRGMVAWLGFKTAALPYDTGRRIAGQSKYSARKMARLGTEAIFSFSLVPVYVGLLAGVLFLLMAGAEALWVAVVWILGGRAGLVPGWSSLMFISLFMGGVLVLLISTVGVYVGLIYQEVKRRPVYIVMDSGAADEAHDQPQGSVGTRS